MHCNNVRITTVLETLHDIGILTLSYALHVALRALASNETRNPYGNVAFGLALSLLVSDILCSIMCVFGFNSTLRC